MGKIRRVSTLLLLFAALLPGAVLAQELSHPELLSGIKTVTSPGEAEEWLRYYYKHPRPDLALSALKVIETDARIQQQFALLPVSAFVAQIFRANPDLAPQAVRQLRSNIGRQLMLYAVWLSGLDSSTELLEEIKKGADERIARAAKEMMYRVPPDFLKDAVDSPTTVEALWGSYFASGDRRYVEKIASVLPLKNRSDEADSAIGIAAQDTLMLALARDPDLKPILETRLKTASAEEKPVLAEVIAKAASGTR
ncbi:MAG TPA: hypothetical protein VN622_01880 [Clostridia bacterium]|nr:hypothetical protein [Clostridia bacterium]